MVGFGGLRDLNDGRFSVSVVFFLFHYKISEMVGFGGLHVLRDGRFCWVTRSQ